MRLVKTATLNRSQSQRWRSIACDEASQSEIVVPIIIEGKPVGVMDLDSPIKSRFDEIDQKYLEEFVKILIGKTDFI